MKKSIKKNYIYNLIYQVLVAIIPVITTPYLARKLGAEAIGIYGYTISIVTYFVLFGTLGINTYGQREIAFYQDDIKKRSKVFFELWILKALTMIISIFLFIMIFTIKNIYSLYYTILILELISNLIDISWLYQGMEEFKKIVLRNLIIKLISIILIFVLIKSPSDLYKYIIIYVVSNLLGNLSLYLNINKYVEKIKLRNLELKKHLKPTLCLFIPQIAIQIYTVLDKTMLGLITNDMNEVGYYEQAQKIVKITLMIVTALGTVMIPRIANLYHKKDNESIDYYLSKSFNFVWIIGTPLLFGLISISSKFVPWFFGTGFDKVELLMCCLAFLLYAIGFNNVIGMQYLVPTEKQNIFTISVTIGAIVNIIFNIVLIIFFGAIGACISTVMAETSILIYQIYYVKKNNYLNITSIYKKCYKYLISGMIMGICVYFLGKNMDATFITTSLQISIGGIIYISLLALFKDQFLIENFNIIKKKVFRR